MLWRILGPKREEVAGGCRRLHNEEIRGLYASSNVVRVVQSGGGGDGMSRTCGTGGRVEKRILCFGWWS